MTVPNSWRKGKPPRYVSTWYQREPWLQPKPFERLSVEVSANAAPRFETFRDVMRTAMYQDNAESRSTMDRWTWQKIRRVLPTSTQRATGNLWRWIRNGNCNDFTPAYIRRLMANGLPRGAMQIVICKVPDLRLHHMALRLAVSRNGGYEWFDNRLDTVFVGMPENYQIVAMEGDDAGFWWYPAPRRVTLANLIWKPRDQGPKLKIRSKNYGRWLPRK